MADWKSFCPIGRSAVAQYIRNTACGRRPNCVEVLGDFFPASETIGSEPPLNAETQAPTSTSDFKEGVFPTSQPSVDVR
jgi:hypothetical protein